MFTREELLSSPEYWFEDAQNELFRQVQSFMESENINRSELALKLGVSKGYISQILNGNFNYTLKKLIELSLSIGVIPKIEYKDLNEEIKEDQIRSRFLKQETQTTLVKADTVETMKLVYNDIPSNIAA